MSDVDDLLAFVRAQLDEDERWALAASPGPWKPNAEHDEVLAVDDITVADGFALSNNQLRATVGHIARWDPVCVLAHVKATRRILAHIGMVVISPGREALPPEYVEQMELFARTLGQPYAGRPGWREEWRVDPPA